MKRYLARVTQIVLVVSMLMPVSMGRSLLSQPNPTLLAPRSSLPQSRMEEIYRNIYTDFMSLEKMNEEAIRLKRSYFDREGPRLIPKPVDVYPLYIDLSQNQFIQAFLEGVIKEIKEVLPKNISAYAAPKESFHISVYMAQDLRPDDKLNPDNKDLFLTSEEIDRLKKVFQDELGKAGPFLIQLVGIRFSSDGGVIAIFKDQGELKKLRGNLAQRASGVTKKVEKTKYPKDLIHITLFRILEDISGETLAKLKQLAQKYENLEEKGMEHWVNTITFGHEIGWMHSKFETDSNQTFPFLGGELAHVGSGVEASL